MTTTPLPQGLRVLVVDDHRDAADSLTLLLKLWGYQPLVAYDGPSALATALDHDVVASARQLARAPRRGGHRAIHQFGQPLITHQHVERGARGAAGACHIFAQF